MRLALRSAEYPQVIRDEDYAIAANVQRTLGSGGVSHFVLGRNEAALQHLHNTCRSVLGQEPLKLHSTPR